MRILNISNASASDINHLAMPDDSIPVEDIRAAINIYDNAGKNYLGLIRFLKSNMYLEVFTLVTYTSSLITSTNPTTKIAGQMTWIV